MSPTWKARRRLLKCSAVYFIGLQRWLIAPAPVAWGKIKWAAPPPK